jgi:hypothetical protein
MVLIRRAEREGLPLCNFGSTVFGMAHEVGYARVSKREQNPMAQEAELRAAGCERVFVDHGESSRATAKFL